MKRLSLVFALGGALVMGALPALADNLDRRVRIASDIVANRMESRDSIPDYVIEQARCVISIKVVKAGLIWGGSGSTGLVSCRTADGWSAPSFINVSGVSFGIQIGVQFMESVLVVVSDQGRRILDRANFQIGTDVSFAAGPVGSGSGKMPDADILSYQRTRGLYAGATVNGFILSHGKVRNRRAYEGDISGSTILAIPGSQAPAVLKEFVDTLETYTP